jgi:hypothetical protein
MPSAAGAHRRCYTNSHKDARATSVYLCQCRSRARGGRRVRTSALARLAGGCLGGGGQPIPTSPSIRAARTKAIYSEDMGLPIRKSHENPHVL